MPLVKATMRWERKKMVPANRGSHPGMVTQMGGRPQMRILLVGTDGRLVQMPLGPAAPTDKQTEMPA